MGLCWTTTSASPSHQPLPLPRCCGKQQQPPASTWPRPASPASNGTPWHTLAQSHLAEPQACGWPGSPFPKLAGSLRAPHPQGLGAGAPQECGMRSFISKNTELLPSSRAREAASAAPPQRQGLVRSRLRVNHPFLRSFLGGKPRGGCPCPQGHPADVNVPSAPVRGRGAVYEPRNPPGNLHAEPRVAAPVPQRGQRPQPLHKGRAIFWWDVARPAHSCPLPLPPGPTGAGSSLFCPNPSQHITAAG